MVGVIISNAEHYFPDLYTDLDILVTYAADKLRQAEIPYIGWDDILSLIHKLDHFGFALPHQLHVAIGGSLGGRNLTISLLEFGAKIEV